MQADASFWDEGHITRGEINNNNNGLLTKNTNVLKKVNCGKCTKVHITH